MGKPTCLNKCHYLPVLFLILIGGIFQSYSQCPTVTNPLQSFCDIPTPVVSNLAAINNGGGIRWYATAISTTPLSNSAPLINGEDYYADDNTGTCGVRPRVDVIIVGPPIGQNFQGVCVDDPNDATISDLIAVGNDVKWYLVPFGGTPLLPSTVLMDNTIYYADQANPVTGCRTSRLSVFVNVGVVPIPTGDPVQEFCSDLRPPPTVADLVASGNNNWYATPVSATPLDPSTPLVDGETYYATTVDPPCESIQRFEVLVVFTDPNDSGIDGNIDICETDITTIQTVDLFPALGGTPGNDGSWTGPLPTTNGSLGTVDITSMTVAGSPYVFTYTVSSSTACAPSSSTVSVNIIEGPDAGLDGTLDLCDNDGPVDLFDSLGGTPDTGGIWSPPLTSGTGVFDPQLDPPGVYTYTVAGTPPCGDGSATVTVMLTAGPDAGLDGTLDLCDNDGPVDLFDSLGGTPDTGGTWSPPLSSGTGVFDPQLDPPGVYTYTVAGTPPCGGNDSATVTVSIITSPDVTGAVMFASSICLNSSNNVDITDATFLADGTYTIIYELSGANTSQNSVNINFVNGDASFTIPAALLTNTGQTTVTIKELFIVGSTCTADVSSIAPIQFLIENGSTPVLITGGNVFCIADGATIADLTANIIDSTPIVWYDAPQNGNPYATTTLLVDGETYYASTTSANGCESGIRLKVTVSIIDCNPELIIPDGFSPNGDGINDTFVIKNLRKLYSNFTLGIYNRYGNVLYKGNGKSPDWDGTTSIGTQMGSSELPVGVYFFILNFNKGDEGPLQGRIYLSR